MKFSPEEYLEFIDADDISTWDFTKKNEWNIQNGNLKSDWVLTPPDGEVWLYSEVKILLSSSTIIDKSIFIEFRIPGISSPVKTVIYRGRADLAIRSETITMVPHNCKIGNDLSEDFHVYSLQFAEDVLLWSSAGLANDGTPKTYGSARNSKPKIGSMVMRIEGDQPLQGQMAKCRYHVCRYVDKK